MGHFSNSSGRDFQDGMHDESGGDAYPEIVSEAHENNGTECRDEFGHISEIDFCYRIDHKDSDDD